MMSLLLAAAMSGAPPSPYIRISPRRNKDSGVTLTPAGMFAVAEAAQRRNDPATAETIYRALMTNPALEIRNEARFRLARMFANEHKYTDSAVLLRAILDEQPSAQRVRLELANLLVTMGDEAGARRELRAVRAGPLPPEVAHQVDRFSEALRARKPMGATINLALANDSNVNRATRSDTLGTVIGDFTLDKDARQQAGHGIAIDGQSYGRIALNRNLNLLGTVSGSANLYGKSRFNDIAIGASLGPEITLGNFDVHASAGALRRWFGQEPFTDAASLQLDVAHPISATAQLRGAIAGSRIWNHQNELESGHAYSGSVALEKALSETSGAGLTLTGIRQSLEDPGYSTTSGQVSLFGWHEAGRVTFTGALTYGRLIADERLLLYLDKRNEHLYRASIGATARQVQFKGFAPTVSLTWERNRSPIEIYDYGRTVFDVGVTRAF
jgi:outer membrane protein